MKNYPIKSLILLLAFAGIAGIAKAQKFNSSDQRLYFQAVAFDSTGKPIRNGVIGVQLSIYDSGLAKYIYIELQEPKTDYNGSFYCYLGKPAYIKSGYLSYDQIPWETGRKTLKIEYATTFSGKYRTVGYVALVPYPYAMVAQSSLGVRGVSFDSTKSGQQKHNGSLLIYNSKDKLWEPGYLNAGSGITINDSTGTISATGTSYTAGTGISISGSTISANLIAGNNIKISGDTINGNTDYKVSDSSTSATNKSSGCSGTPTSASPQIYATAPSAGYYFISGHGSVVNNSTTAGDEFWLYLYNSSKSKMLKKALIGHLGNEGTNNTFSGNGNIQTVEYLAKGDKVELQFSNNSTNDVTFGYHWDNVIIIKLK